MPEIAPNVFEISAKLGICDAGIPGDSRSLTLSPGQATRLSVEIEQQMGCTISAGRLARVKSLDALHELVEEVRDPIAIVGMSARFPGATDVEQYWENILGGVECISESTRWVDEEELPFKGGFLEDIAEFDADFFRISPVEARAMDPQQRIMMELSWHALEDAGAPVSKWRELNCGVFISALPGDYKYLLADRPEQAFTTHGFLGNAYSTLSGRISYFYDFKGPSITLDTACSSSLTAFQTACLNVKAGECDAAMVGAVSVFSTPEIFRMGRSANMISTNGRCSSFDDSADGFVPSEGAAAVMIMRRSNARRSNLRVLATVESISVNHDGFSNGLMAPNPKSQASLIRSAYARNHVDPAEVGYLEAHGTGTPVGDPIEIQALNSAFVDSRDKYRCFLGTSKSVIGHSLVCSGLASIVKVLKCMETDTVPASRHFKQLNSLIDLDEFKINTNEERWPAGQPLGAVNAFGFTGTNAHLVLRKEESNRETKTEELGNQSMWFIFSANDKIAFNNKLASYDRLLAGLPEEKLKALSYSLCDGLEVHDLRLAIRARTRKELRATIARILENSNPAPNGFLGSGTAASGDEAIDRWLAGGASQLPGQFEGHRLRLPLYPFTKRRYWVGPDMPAESVGSDTGGAIDSSILDSLRDRLAELLGYAHDAVNVDRSLRDYGVDSLIALQLLESVEGLGEAVRPHELFRFESLRELAEFIDGEARDGAPAPSEGSLDTEKRRDSVHGVRLPPGLVACSTSGPIRWVRSILPGPPILLLPPLNTSFSVWRQQIRRFVAEGIQVHIPCYPGHAGVPFFPGEFSLDTLVNDICAYVDENLGGEAIDAVGWSLGGVLALNCSLRRPEIFRTMTLISAAAEFDDSVFGKTMDLHAELNASEDYLEIIFPDDGSALPERISCNAGMEVLRYYYEFLTDHNVTHELASISIPAMIIHGERDCVISENDVSVLKQIPGADVQIIKNAGHFSPLTSPHEINDLIRRFIYRGNKAEAVAVGQGCIS